MSSLPFTLRLLAMMFAATFGTAVLTSVSAKAEYEPEWEQLIGGYGVQETAVLKPFGVAIAELFGIARPAPAANVAKAKKSPAPVKKKPVQTAARKQIDPKKLRTTIETQNWPKPATTSRAPMPNPERKSAGETQGQALAGKSGDAGQPKPRNKAEQLASIAPAAGKTAPVQVAKRTPARVPASKAATVLLPKAHERLLGTLEGRWSASNCGTRHWYVVRQGGRSFKVLQWQAGRGTFREDRVTLRADTENLELHWVLGAEKGVKKASVGTPVTLRTNRGGARRVEILGMLGGDHYDVAGAGSSQRFEFYRARRCSGP